jgi:hypothetical protein
LRLPASLTTLIASESTFVLNLVRIFLTPDLSASFSVYKFPIAKVTSD